MFLSSIVALLTSCGGSGNGRYQISTTTFGMESDNIYETIIDTRTGTIKSRKKTSFRKYD